jgi:LysM repeat protein
MAGSPGSIIPRVAAASQTGKQSTGTAGAPYQVKKGDTLYKIAARLDVSPTELKKANPQLCTKARKNGDLIYPGDLVQIPTGKSAKKKQPAAADSFDKVQPPSVAGLPMAELEKRLVHAVEGIIAQNQGQPLSPGDQVEAIYELNQQLGRKGLALKDLSPANQERIMGLLTQGAAP